MHISSPCHLICMPGLALLKGFAKRIHVSLEHHQPLLSGIQAASQPQSLIDLHGVRERETIINLNRVRGRETIIGNDDPGRQRC